MRIAFDDQVFSGQRFGGVSRYFVKLAQHLASMQQDVLIVAPINQNSYLKEIPKTRRIGLTFNSFPRGTGRLINKANPILTGTYLRNWRPDIVHETYFRTARRSSQTTPRVVTVYDMIHEIFPENFRSDDTTSVRKAAAVSAADHVICISESTRRDLIERRALPESKISVIHLGVDQIMERQNQSAAQPIRFDSAVRPYLLYVGTRRGYKNFDKFLHSVASDKSLSKDFQIVAFGGGPFTAVEIQLAAELGFTSNNLVHETGSDCKLNDFYRDASAFVYPSLYEGFGLPPLEAMAQCCPVVSSNTSSMPEVIGDAAEYFDPLSTEEMSQAIRAVVYSSERRVELIENGLRRSRFFTWKKCASETLDIYKNVTGLS